MADGALGDIIAWSPIYINTTMEEEVHLYGFTSTPLVKGFVVVGSASPYKEGWLAKSLFDARIAMVKDEEAAIVWLQKWCSATAIIKGTLIAFMERSHQE